MSLIEEGCADMISTCCIEFYPSSHCDTLVIQFPPSIPTHSPIHPYPQAFYSVASCNGKKINARLHQKSTLITIPQQPTRKDAMNLAGNQSASSWHIKDKNNFTSSNRICCPSPPRKWKTLQKHSHNREQDAGININPDTQKHWTTEHLRRLFLSTLTTTLSALQWLAHPPPPHSPSNAKWRGTPD